MQAGTHVVEGADANFMMKAAGSGLYEVEVAHLATQKAQSPQVKQFAEMLVQQHTMANEQLKALAAKKNVSLPQQIPADKQAQMTSLQKASGSEFDSQLKTKGGPLSPPFERDGESRSALRQRLHVA